MSSIPVPERPQTVSTPAKQQELYSPSPSADGRFASDRSGELLSAKKPFQILSRFALFRRATRPAGKVVRRG